MTTSRYPFAIASLLLSAFVACDLSSTAVPALAGCPDLSSVQAVGKVDWAGQFGIDAEAAHKIRTGLQAGLELQRFAARLDAELKTACTGLAQELGAGSGFATGTEACQAAVRAVGEANAKLGAQARVALVVKPPYCSASLDAMSDCLAACDVDLQPGEVDVQCEPGKLSGTCEAACSGTCELRGAARCEGVCRGSCSAQFTGTCGGLCNGTCDGKPANGVACAGRCEGSCSANAEGSCGGQCQGSCELSGSARCDGVCHGSCSAEMKAPRCEGEVKPPKASAECQARCRAEVQASLECQPATVGIVVQGATNADLVARYKRALETHLPAIIKVAVALKDEALQAAADVRAVVVAGQSVVASLQSSGDAGARLAACVAAPFKQSIDAALSVQANVSVSVEVQGQVQGRASASGSAG